MTIMQPRATQPKSRSPLSVALHLLIAAFVVFLMTVPALTVIAQEESEDEDALQASTLTVNVELILDASGSMAETLPGTENQSRMDAAKTAMRDVIERIPEREGLNVGFRIYGHEGSNSQADRAVSCRATELLVPLAGVDKSALLAQVDTFEPTGWTPLALALESAAGDFEPGGESVTNAIIMVTDGEETCDGDPCQVAGALHAADIALTTHVVGFALTGEQQQAVRCIAEEGGGQLYAAEDAESLSEAVFAAFTQVEATPEPVEVEVEAATVVGGFVGGNAFGLLEECTPGELSVVAVGPALDGSAPLVICNDTGADVEDVQVQIIARAGGELVGTGDAQAVQPYVVVDGGVALANGYFGGADIPEGAEFEFTVSADPVDSNEFNSTLDLIIEEVNGIEDGVVGIVSNPHDEPVTGFIIVGIACFDDAGQLAYYGQPTNNNEALAPGQTMPVQASTAIHVDACPYYLLAAYGSGE
jgi:hypothetical protein